MKTGCLATAVLLLAALPARAGWVLQTTGPSTSIFNDVHFVDSLNGFVVGMGGEIRKTTDGGDTWVTIEPSGQGYTLYRVQFPVDAQTGYAVGSSGKILKTVDWGSTWSPVAHPAGTTTLRDLHFIDNDTGFVVGSLDTILFTDNGGTSWTDYSTAYSSTFEAVDFPVDLTTGFIGARNNDYVLQSIDSGASWTDIGVHDVLDIDFVDTQTGFVVGPAGLIARTTNGGSGWTTQNPVSFDLKTVQFPEGATVGYACGGFTGDTGQILKTTDGGDTWTRQYPPIANDINGIFFLNNDVGWAVGFVGNIFKTTNGGGSGLALHPTGLGSVNTFTSPAVGCLVAEGWKCVNDQTGDVGSGPAEPNDPADYAKDKKNNTNRQMYSLDDGLIPAGANVTDIEIRAYVDKGGGPGPEASLSYQRIGIDGTPVDAPSEVIDTSPALITYTWSCLNWSAADIDNLEIGLSHPSGAGADLHLSQIYVMVDYEETATNYRSIGTAPGDLYAAGTATVSACSLDVTFAGGSGVPTSVGLGDKLSIGGETLFIDSRPSATLVTLQEPAAFDHTGIGFSIARAYPSLQAWENDREGNLVAGNRREVGVCYNDATGPFTDRLVISGSITDANYYMHLTVAEGHRHNGLWETGARLDAQGGWGAQDAITVEDEYTRIEWLEILDVEDYADGIFFSASPSADNGLVANVSVHQFSQGSGNAAVRVEANNVTVRNLFATGGTQNAIYVETGSASIENCTLWGTSISGNGINVPSGDVAVKNTISVDHGVGLDIYIETAGAATISYFGCNMFSSYFGGFDPADYQGGNQSPPADPEDLFISLTTPIDLHLEPAGHNAANNGVDLSTDFSNDIDGESRTGSWDIGADEALGGGAPPKIVRWREVDPN